MRQYVNLLGPEFRRQRQFLTLGRALALVAVVAAVMAMLQFHDDHRLAGLREELASAQTLLKAQTAYTAGLKGEGAAKPGNTGLDAEVQRLEVELKTARESMAVLEGGGLGNRNGFAGYFQAFSRQALDGLWLTGFTVGGAGEVAIQGRVMAPDLVPAYIQKLNKEPVLQGREFSALEMRRPEAAPAKDAGGKAEVPRYIEFVLATVNAAEKTEAGGAKK
ncbi:MAG: PilN domain-containing protein [Burkholderiales bacterium]|nr:PilN domain-containing protein [Burkholderiales bacterium]